MNDIKTVIEHVENKSDFINFLKKLQQDYKDRTWENSTLEEYLIGLESWTDDMDGYFLNMNDFKTLKKIENNNIDWKLFAHILFAASMYE